ncbi:Hypothetical predicted protein [Paramuricea clavata]|uniref:Uncharacterized protein n=1 Tax=Paramuricea clavata TaxID=317549 RepID=A0A6S7IM76_PARCT|nr:Hypothetical predicted protein [Paramuricea clavata]
MKLAFTVNMFDRKHSWIYRDVFWFVFVWSLVRLGEAESKCTEAFFKQIDGQLAVRVTKRYLSKINRHIRKLTYNTKLRTSASCEELHQIGGDLPNGVYNIQTKTNTGMTKTYCQMTSLEGCAGGGWTMVMKVDGHKKTFNYSSSYWSNEQTFNPIGGTSGFDDVETKLPTYWSTSFQELCIGMKVGNDLRFLTIPYANESLHSVIADGKFHRTFVGREKWKSLLADASLQRQCNKEGFNNYKPLSQSTGVRIGILGNEQNDCNSPDSFLGIGAKHQAYGCPVDNSGSAIPTSGNCATWQPDNGRKNIKSMGYILVR